MRGTQKLLFAKAGRLARYGIFRNKRIMRTPFFSRSMSRTLLISAGALLVAFLPQRVSAYSILLNPPAGWNGFFFEGNIVTGFRESAGPGTLLTTNTQTLLVAPDFPDPTTPGLVFSNGVGFTSYPASGLPKDMSGGYLYFTYTVGDGTSTSSDSFNFGISATNSAASAMVDFGSGLAQADAFFQASFSLTSAWPLETSAGAMLGLPAMPSLTTTSPHIESMIAVATLGPFGSPTTTYTRVPGDASLVVPVSLPEGDFFEYKLDYTLLTPYGSDPAVSYQLSGSMATAVPEPSTTALLTLAVTTLVIAVKRRRG